MSEKLKSPQFEEVACNLCGGKSTRAFTECQGMKVVQCVHCDLVYVNPRLGATALHEHYNSDQSSRIQYYLDVAKADRRTFDEILDLAGKYFPRRGRLLDIGPNIGTCLTMARDRGWEVQGIEINAVAAQYCRDTHGLDVISGILDKQTFPMNSFDVVLMGDVIEHLRDPKETMGLIQRIMKPGGVVIISTPNIGGWAGRLLQIKPEEHLYYFAPKTITTLMNKVGLEVATIKSLDRYHNLTAMTHSTTLGGLFQKLAPVFHVAHAVVGDLIMRLPLRENLLAVARKPANYAAKAA